MKKKKQKQKRLKLRKVDEAAAPGSKRQGRRKAGRYETIIAESDRDYAREARARGFDISRGRVARMRGQRIKVVSISTFGSGWRLAVDGGGAGLFLGR